VSVLLDTNACVAGIRGRPPVARERIQQAAERGEMICVSSITVFELWYGVGRSDRATENTDQLAAFLKRVRTIPFENEDAETAGLLRARLRKLGKLIGPYDLLLAGQALRRDLILVTANVSEFSRVEGLRCENWEA
jgi:tRNA(fMet)-specific endonuclease VapC